MAVRKNDIADAIRSKFSQTESRRLLESLLEILKSRLEKGEDVKIYGFGKWSVRQKHRRQGRNPKNGEIMEIAARKIVTFHPSDKFRNIVRENWKINE